MPRTETDVANEALLALKEKRIASINDTGKVPEALKFALPLVREAVLRDYDWTCARRRAILTEITEEAPGVPVVNLTGRAHVFQKPDDALTIRELVDQSQNGSHYYADQTGTSFIQEGDRIYTDLAEPVAIYTKNADDPAEWDSLLATAVALMLAWKVAYEITGDRADENAAAQAASAFLAQARKATMAEQSQPKMPSQPFYPGLFDEEMRR